MSIPTSNLVRLMKRGPFRVFRAMRGYLLFLISRWIRVFFFWNRARVVLDDNVRLQKNSSLMAEAPDARILIGADTVVYENSNVAAYSKGYIEIGPGSILGDIRIEARYGIRIGERFLSSWNVFIQDYDPHPTSRALRKLQMQEMVGNFRPVFNRPFTTELGQTIDAVERKLKNEWNYPGEEIIIGDDVWVGANVTILKGARIGDGCIVGSGSIVVKGEYPAGSIIAGNPAKVVKDRPDERTLKM